MARKYVVLLIAAFISITSIANTKSNPLSSPLSITGDFTSIINGTNVACTASFNSTVVPVQYQWDWGDGDSSNFTAQNYISHQYAAAGTYTIRLIVVNILNERDTVFKNVTLFTNVSNNITADFSYYPTTIFVGTAVQLTDLSTIGTGTITDWYWTTDGGLTFLSGQNTAFTFSAPGNYTILHKVYSSIGEMDTISKTITVLPANHLVANFTYSPDTLHAGDPAQFINTSTMSSGVIVAYNWNFGDGQNVAVQNPIHTFSATGIYTISLTVTNNFGETSIVSKAVIVYPPTADQKVELCPATDSTQLTSFWAGTTYQWQISTDSGVTFNNIADNSNYNGTNLRWLQLKNIPSAWTGYKYRCITNGHVDAIYKIVFSNRFVSVADSAWENAANWACGNVPDANTDVVIPAGSNVVLNSNASCATITVSPGASFTVNPGFTLTITH